MSIETPDNKLSFFGALPRRRRTSEMNDHIGGGADKRGLHGRDEAEAAVGGAGPGAPVQELGCV